MKPTVIARTAMAGAAIGTVVRTGSVTAPGRAAREVLTWSVPNSRGLFSV